MNLQRQIYLIIGTTSLVLLLIIVASSWYIVLDKFGELERREAQHHLKQVATQLESQLRQLVTTTRDWAAWDATYDFVTVGKEDYVQDNLNHASLDNLRLSALIYTDHKGRVTHAVGWDAIAKKKVAPHPQLLDLLQTRNDLLREAMQKGPMQGFTSLNGVPLAVAMQPILHNDGTGEAAGVLVATRIWAEIQIRALQEVMGLQFSLTSTLDREMRRRLDQGITEAGRHKPIAVVTLDNDTVLSFTKLPGLSGEPPLFLKVIMDRVTYQMGERTALYFIAWLTVGALVIIAAMGWQLHKRVTSRLTLLTSKVGEITLTDDRSLRLPAEGNDELASLAGSINDMLAALREAHDEVVRSAHRYHGIVEDQSELICRFDSDLRLTFANHALYRYFALSEGEALGRELGLLLPALKKPEIRELLNGLRPESPTGEMDVALDRGNKEESWLHITFRAIYQLDGSLYEYQAMGQDVTDRLRAAHALRESEELYRTLFERAGECIFLLKAEGEERGQIVDTNQTAAKVFHYSVEELKTMNIADLISRDQLDELPEAMEDAFVDAWDYWEVDHVTKEGELVPTEVSSGAVILGGQKFILGFVRDISERKKAQQELEERQRWYRTTFEHTGTAMAVLEEDSTISMANEQFALMLGYTREEVEGKIKWYESTSPEDMERMKEYRRRRLLGEKAPNQYEFTLVDRYGTQRHMLLSVVLIPGTKSVVTSMLDITERKKGETALRESEARLRAIMEANPDPTVVYDSQGRTTYFNPAFTRVFGWTFEDLSGRLIPFVPDDQRELTKRMIMLVYATGGPVQFETERFSKDGERLEVNINAMGIKNAQGEVTGMVVNINDITEQKHLSSQLMRAQKMEAVGTLAGGIAHDFNNVLQVIRGYAQLLSWEDDAKENTGEYGREIEQAASRGAELVQRLLTFSRKLEPELKEIDLNQEVERAAALLERIIPKMINISVDLEQNIDIVEADRTQLEQILLNLGTNARDAMTEGGTLTIQTENVLLDESFCKLHPSLSPGRHVLLSVSDTGHGIDSETREHIFEPFFTTKEAGQGTGMGLSSVYGIVQSHRGFISCYSEPGQGTVFNIYLPSRDSKTAQASPEDALETELPWGSETIMVVDDESGVRQIGQAILEKRGFKVIQAGSGEDALEILAGQADEVDLVMLDLNMPGMGGRRCLDLILERHPSIPVVVVSGYTDSGQVENIMSEGASAFVGKPFRLYAMLRTVREVLDRTGARQMPGEALN